MAETIVDGTQFNAQNVRYSAPKANAAGGKSVNILNTQTNSGLRVATPLMLTWGASEFEGNGKFEMSLQFPRGEYANADTDAFLRNIQALEAKVKADALTNSKDWFGKQHTSPEVIDALYSPMLKYSKDKLTGNPDLTKAPTLRVKIPQWEGVWKCLICDEDGQKLFPGEPTKTPLDFVKKGTHLAVIMQCGGIWFANGKFGVTWKLAQAVVQRPKGSLLDECLIKLKPSDKARLQAAPAPDADDDEPTSGALVADSDEEDEEEDEPVVPTPAPVAVAPPPAPVAEVKQAVAAALEEPKKKKVVKKKVAEA
jgi:hypothetical protein